VENIKIQLNKISVIYVFLIIWLIINLLQSTFTGLGHDEAYYWFYSQKLQWGYFDHPPAIALFIKLTSIFGNSPFMVRFSIVLLGALTILLIYKTIQPKKVLLFCLVISSVAIFQVISFVATPDTILVFFCSLFFYSYKKYLDKNNLLNSLWVLISISGMVYSKYHAFLLIAFVVLSNLFILRRISFWILTLLALIIYLPHILWQFSNHFPSMSYHFVERSHDESFRMMAIPEYLGGQIGIFGPFVSIFLFYYLFKAKAKDYFQKALKYSSIAIFIFFLASVLKGNVQANWTLVIFPGIIIFSYPYIEERIQIHRILKIISFISIFLLIVVRIQLASNAIPFLNSMRNEFYGWEKWAKDLKQRAGQRQVVFHNSYQKASKYYFYTGDSTTTFSDWVYRKSQFDLSGIEQKLQNRSIFFVDAFDNPNNSGLFVNSFGDTTRFIQIDSLFSVYNYQVRVENPPKVMRCGTIFSINVEVHKPDYKEITGCYQSDIWLFCELYQKGKIIQYDTICNLKGKPIHSDFKTLAKIKLPENPGIYYFRFSLQTGNLPPGLNSKLLKIKLEN